MLSNGFSSHHRDMFWQIINNFTTHMDWNGLSMNQELIQDLLVSTFAEMMNGHTINFMDRLVN